MYWVRRYDHPVGERVGGSGHVYRLAGTIGVSWTIVWSPQQGIPPTGHPRELHVLCMSWVRGATRLDVCGLPHSVKMQSSPAEAGMIAVS
jgi:hypothetical protein